MGQTPRPSGPFLKRLNAFTRAARRIDQADVKAVHWTRVASRRLREWLPVLGLRPEATQKLNRRLKKVTKQLGGVRELDVMMRMLQEFDGEARYPSNALNQVGAMVKAQRLAAEDRLAAKLSVQKLRRLARRLQRAVADSESNVLKRPHNTPPSSRAWAWAIDARASRRAANLRVAIEAAGSVYAPERLHDVRIAVKKFRYALELRTEARKQRVSRDITMLKTAQNLLGRLHDVEILIARAHQTQAALSPPTLTVWRELDALVDALEDDCRGLHARYMRDRTALTAIANRVQNGRKITAPVVRRAVS